MAKKKQQCPKPGSNPAHSANNNRDAKVKVKVKVTGAAGGAAGSGSSEASSGLHPENRKLSSSSGPPHPQVGVAHQTIVQTKGGGAETRLGEVTPVAKMNGGTTAPFLGQNGVKVNGGCCDHRKSSSVSTFLLHSYTLSDGGSKGIVSQRRFSSSKRYF